MQPTADPASLRRRARLTARGGIALLILLLGLGAWLIQSFVGATVRVRSEVDASYATLQTMAGLRLELLRARFFLRRLVSEGAAEQEPAATTSIASTRAALRTLAASIDRSPLAATTLRQVIVEVEDLLQATERGLRLAEQGSVDDAKAVIQAEQTDSLRLLLDEAIAAERRQLALNDEAAQRSVRRLALLLTGVLSTAGITGAMAVLALAGRLRQATDGMAQLAAAKREVDGLNAALAEGEGRLQTMVAAAGEAIFVVAPDGLVTFANPACAVVFGRPERELLGMAASALVPGLAEPGPMVPPVAGRRADGRAFPAEVTIGTFAAEGGQARVCAVRDISERQRLERLKDEFVSTVSHELRTPLTSIRGSLGLVIGGVAGPVPDKARQLIEIAHKNSQRLVGLVNDILDIERLDAGGLEFRREPVDMAHLVNAAVDANLGFAAQYGVTLTSNALTADAARPTVLGDPDRLLQALTNLISNAVKFSDPGDVVTLALSAGAGPGTIRVAVTDRGPGVPESFRPRIFSRFAQADGSDVRLIGGTGLGLSIAKAIIDRHGGSIGFESPVADGLGSRFWFELPPLSPDAAELPAERPHGRLLICEDNEDVANLLALMLEKDGWACEIVATAEAALDRLASERFDAMTTDLRLPGMDGVELIRRLRAQPATRELPIAVVSAMAIEGRQALEGQDIDILDWLAKPIDQQRLRHSLARALRGQPGEAPRILHVEDDDDLVAVVRALMEGTARIVQARTLAEARLRLAEGGYTLVVLDSSRDGSGLDLLPQIEASRPRPRLLLLTADDRRQPDARVESVLVKTRTDNDRLFQTITRLLEPASPQPET